MLLALNLYSGQVEFDFLVGDLSYEGTSVTRFKLLQKESVSLQHHVNQILRVSLFQKMA